MRRFGVLAAAVLCLLGARTAGSFARDQRATWPRLIDVPYAPAPAAAPMVTLGYREVAADLLWIRALGYFGGDDDTADGVRGIIESIVSLDPKFRRAYTWGSVAVNNASGGNDNDAGLWAVALLEKGMEYFPDSSEMPLLAGQILVVDLRSKDPAQIHAWHDKGALLLERAARMPGAPEGVATLVATLRTQLGQRDRARAELHEMILLAKDEDARQKLIRKLAELDQTTAEAINAETRAERQRFEKRWIAERPELPPTMYVLLGPRPRTAMRTEELAVDRDLIGANDEETNLDDEAAPSVDGEAAPSVGEPAPAAPATPRP